MSRAAFATIWQCFQTWSVEKYFSFTLSNRENASMPRTSEAVVSMPSNSTAYPGWVTGRLEQKKAEFVICNSLVEIARSRETSSPTVCADAADERSSLITST